MAPSSLPNGTFKPLVGNDGIYKNASDVKNLTLSDFPGAASLEDPDIIIVPGTVTITTNKLQYDSDDPSDNLIKGYDPLKTSAGIDTNWQEADAGGSGLYYRDVQITCIVLAENTCKDVLKNIAEISEAQNENGEDMNDTGDDIDSTPGNHDPEEDDEDYDQVQLKYFDLALKKFISGVKRNDTTTPVDREPVVTMPTDFKHDLIYTFPENKEQNPVDVTGADIVIYTIRVYNEGTIAGYANEVKDNIPEGLQFLPDDEVNKAYEWNMYYIDEEGNPVKTDDVSKATQVRTAYLSQDNGTQNEIQAFDSSKPISDTDPLNPDYRDVQVAFKVMEPTSKDKRVIKNTAEISDDSGDDEDSTPDDNIPEEDDQDDEYINVKYFDLALIKYVSQTIVTVNGKTTTSPYLMPADDPGSRYEVKVDIGKNDIKKTTVKFVYTIKIINDSEIAGSATEITDDIPAGLAFDASDSINTQYKWTKVGDNKVTTNFLDGKILQPEESATVQIAFTWIQDGSNVGTKNNIATITGFYNEYGSPDSNPNNNQDNALVIIEMKTGGSIVYVPLAGLVLAILAGGVFLIKKYVL